jgi:hypothetical protein
MTKAKEIDKKVDVSNVRNSRPSQWDGKNGNSYLMWKVKFMARLTMLGHEECLMPEFDSELPSKEKEEFDLTSDEGKKWANAVKKNKKAMMQFAFSFTKVAQLNKLNRAGRINKD